MSLCKRVGSKVDSYPLASRRINRLMSDLLDLLAHEAKLLGCTGSVGRDYCGRSGRRRNVRVACCVP